MYQKYTTEGFLVLARASGEADKLYLFYTADFGMIFASARSVRSLKSKLRPHIIFGSKLSITLLKSKNRWKLLETKAVGEQLGSRSSAYRVFIKLLLVLKTLAFGEERNESLYESIAGAFDRLAINADDSKLPAIECLAMVKILHSLGYGEPKNDREYEIAEWSDDVLDSVMRDKRELVSSINKALGETGLQ